MLRGENRRLPLTSIFLFAVIFGITLHAADKDTVKGSLIKDEIGKELISKQLEYQKATEFFQKASDAYSKNNYAEARDHYLTAKKNLEEIGGQSEFILNKIAGCEEAIAKCYFRWSEQIASDAEKAGNAEEYDKALDLCRKAVKIYPPITDRMVVLMKKYSHMKKIVTYRNQVSEKTVDPEKESRLYNIDVLIRQGVVLFNDNQLDKARDKFEEVLAINPYNLKAIEYIRQINRKFLEIGYQRTSATHAERMAETEWKMITPLIPRTLTGENETIHSPVAKEDVESTIEKKLRDIIIDHIEFEEVTIPTVIKYLKQRSKQIDKDKVGVNIFLRLSGTKAKESNDEDDYEDDYDEDDLGGGGPTGPTGPPSHLASGSDDDGDIDSDDDDDDDDYDNDTQDFITDEITDIPTVTMVVDDISLAEAIRYICRATNLKYRIEKYAVVIASPNVALDDVETRIYPLEQEALDEIGGGEDPDAVKDHFKKRGINFPAGAKIVYDPRISRLIATNTPDNLGKIEEIIREINVVDPQVLIQAKFVEITQNDLDELGFEYQLSRQTGTDRTFDPNDNTMRNVKDSGLGNATAGTRRDEVFGVTHVTGDNYRMEAVIHALDQSDTADVLSTPRVTTMNGQEATIRMITDFYYPESWNEAQMATDGTFVPSTPVFGDPTELGIVFRVTPNVDADHYTITLDMNPVVQTLAGWTDYSYSLSAAGTAFINMIRMPIIEARTVETSITIYDGETIVLGGIIRDTTDTINDKIPILGEIPLIGRMFQSKATATTKTNLLIFLTCRLINPDGSPIRERELRGLPPFRQ